MSIETNEELTTRFELYRMIEEGLDDVVEGRTETLSESISDILSYRENNS